MAGHRNLAWGKGPLTWTVNSTAARTAAWTMAGRDMSRDCPAAFHPITYMLVVNMMLHDRLMENHSRRKRGVNARFSHCSGADKRARLRGEPRTEPSRRNVETIVDWLSELSLMARLWQYHGLGVAAMSNSFAGVYHATAKSTKENGHT